ncbi:MAG: cellulose biosynthesis cyclic di-GMP-binding regulatory protein BcsB, partial [Geminicoccaceae bacterium]|nr:cellulose biosynthesis cyclic di-GMP-binding regulatory protein BcsB [Geminicoccaceae bacterium]
MDRVARFDRPRRLAGLTAGAAVALSGVSALALEARIPLPLADTNLDGGRSRTEGTIGLPPSLVVEQATLRIGYANALAVDPGTSGLVVAIGDAPVAELPLVAAQGDVQAEIQVPPSAFRSGANPIRFTARQDHRAACERTAFTELWTRLDAETSHLELDLRPHPEGLTLANLDAVLGASLYDGEPLVVTTARPLDDAALLAWGGLVAEGAALRRGQRPLQIEHAGLSGAASNETRTLDLRSARGNNLVVVGTFAELEGVLPPSLPEGAALGVVAVRALPADPMHAMVIISGENDAAVTRAAEAFRSRRSDWPESAVAPVGLKAQPASAPVASPLAHGGEVTLAEFGYATDEVPVSFTETIDIEVVLPETYYAGDGQRVELGLDFAYGAGLAPTSALIIRLNGAPWNMLRLDRSSGAIVGDARVELPMGLFRPGRNVIGFEPVLHPADPSLCETIGTTPMFTLFDDSRLNVPRFASLARQPDLRLFATSGFPMAAAEEGLEIVLGELTRDTIAAAWTLRGKLAQSRGAPLAEIRTVRQPSGERHILALGAPEALPVELTQAAPLPLLNRLNADPA